jgi:hypothetical protein
LSHGGRIISAISKIKQFSRQNRWFFLCQTPEDSLGDAAGLFYDSRMRAKPFHALVLGVATLLFALPPDVIRAETEVDPKIIAMILEAQVQQKTIVENQTKIDEKLTVIAEDLRLARIFASRGGNAK